MFNRSKQTIPTWFSPFSHQPAGPAKRTSAAFKTLSQCLMVRNFKGKLLSWLQVQWSSLVPFRSPWFISQNGLWLSPTYIWLVSTSLNINVVLKQQACWPLSMLLAIFDSTNPICQICGWPASGLWPFVFPLPWVVHDHITYIYIIIYVHIHTQIQCTTIPCKARTGTSLLYKAN